MADREALESMTVAQLREECAAHGIEPPSKARKAELVELVLGAEEPLDVEPAETAIVQFPKLSEELAEKEARLTRILADYEGWEPDPLDEESVKAAKDARSTVNALCKQVDDRRKEVKNLWMAPYMEYESACNGVKAKGKDFADKMKRAIDQAALDYQSAKLKKLEEYYNDLAPLLAPVVPFSKLCHGTKWRTKGMKMEACESEIDSTVSRIAQDWETLKAMGLEHQDDAERVFFQSLDLGEAISHDKRLTESQRKLEELRRATQRPEKAPEPTPAPPIPKTAPQMPQKPPMPPKWEPVEEFPPEAYEPEPTEPEPAAPNPCVMFMDDATSEQLALVGAFAKSIGVHGKFRRYPVKVYEAMKE